MALAGVIGVLFLLAAFVLPWRAARAAADSGAQLSAAMGQLRIAVLDTMTGWREVRAFGAEGRMLAAIQAREAALLGAQHGLAMRTALAGAGAFMCAQAELFAVLCAAGTASPGSVGTAIVAAFLVLAAFEVIGGLPRAGAYLGHAAAAAHRVLEAADAPVPVADPAMPGTMPEGSRLAFDSVHFQWRPELPKIFDGLTMEIAPGSRIGVLGPSGSGKSTLAALALKIAAPQSGRVILARADIASLAAADVRARIGWLSQTTHLFDDTIRNNLLLASPEADDAALWAALEAARIADVARALPDGLDTWVGEGGARFSGGQGRRLALARALAVAGADPDPGRALRGFGCRDGTRLPGHAERGRRGTHGHFNRASAGRSGETGPDLSAVRGQGCRGGGLSDRRWAVSPCPSHIFVRNSTGARV